MMMIHLPLWYCWQERQGNHGSIDPAPPRILHLGQQAQGSFWPSSEILSEKYMNITRQFMGHALDGISFLSTCILEIGVGKSLENS